MDKSSGQNTVRLVLLCSLASACFIDPAYAITSLPVDYSLNATSVTKTPPEMQKGGNLLTHLKQLFAANTPSQVVDQSEESASTSTPAPTITPLRVTIPDFDALYDSMHVKGDLLDESEAVATEHETGPVTKEAAPVEPVAGVDIKPYPPINPPFPSPLETASVPHETAQSADTASLIAEATIQSDGLHEPSATTNPSITPLANLSPSAPSQDDMPDVVERALREATQKAPTPVPAPKAPLAEDTSTPEPLPTDAPLPAKIAKDANPSPEKEAVTASDPVQPLPELPAAASQEPSAPEQTISAATNKDVDQEAPIVLPSPPKPEVDSAPSEPTQKHATSAPVALEAIHPKEPATPSPEKTLSAESKKVVQEIARHAATATSTANRPIAIDHSNKIPNLDGLAEALTQTKSHESVGIKVEVKTPKVNLDYELEKAYNASISGQSDEAVFIYKNVLDIDPRNKNALFGLATTYHRSGQVALARPLYARLLAIDPGYRDGLNNFLVLLADEAPEEALTQLQQLQRTNPSYSPIPAQMAVIYQKLGQFDSAAENMRHAISLAPENLTYRYNFAVMLDKQHQYAEAIQLYKQIIQAYQRGETIPGNVEKIQQRLTFISSNKP